MATEEFNYLHNKIFQVFFILKWSIFCLMHISLFVVLLFLIWWFQIQPFEVADKVTNALTNSLLPNIFVVWGFLGLSGGTILWLYARAWNWLFAIWSNHFIFNKHGKS
ncbi:MAG TPA: hypothetical protein VK967_01300 [Methylotenera sp.]|nr:hypothetical protein [Methylotenera sp.]